MASLGSFLLLATFVVCAYSAVVSVVGARQRSRRLIESGIGSFYLVCALMTCASAVMINAFLTNDFTIKYVAHYSDSVQPLFYKITSYWGGLDGSIMFWVFLLSVFGSIAVYVNRERYRELIKKGLKGSGDYGVVGFGPYSGQGLNRSDVNGDLHFVARVAYPFKLDNGQFFELGLQGYTGRYVVGNQAITIGTNSITPSVLKNGHADQRAALSAIWYPQPFGVEAEWNIGEGPELNSAYNRVQGQFLHGGYVQLNYKIDQGHSTWFPYVRWQYYEGGRKFARNAPRMNVNEAEIGLEYSPWPEVEFSVSYTHTYQRTNTRVAPYADTSNADRLGFQVQVNY